MWCLNLKYRVWPVGIGMCCVKAGHRLCTAAGVFERESWSRGKSQIERDFIRRKIKIQMPGQGDRCCWCACRRVGVYTVHGEKRKSNGKRSRFVYVSLHTMIFGTNKWWQTRKFVCSTDCCWSCVFRLLLEGEMINLQTTSSAAYFTTFVVVFVCGYQHVSGANSPKLESFDEWRVRQRTLDSRALIPPCEARAKKRREHDIPSAADAESSSEHRRHGDTPKVFGSL